MKRCRLACIMMAVLMLLVSCTNKEKEETVTAANPVSENIVISENGEYPLSGKLTLPGSGDKFPVVILVHDSGSCDYNETVGKQMLFSDISGDLARCGVATIRYDKRTHTYSDEMSEKTDLTAKEEVIDDVMSAVELALNDERIDSNRIYVAGHGYGGYLIPRIDAADTDDSIAGYIFLAGSALSPAEVLPDQIDYILSVSSESEEDKQTYREYYESAYEAIMSLTEDDCDSNITILGEYPAYWLDLADYDPVESVRSVKEPMLFLQGEHDYQVTMDNFSLWKAGLSDREDVKFITYSDLSHTFVSTESMSTPDDYYVYGITDEAVSADISQFIADLSK